MDKLIFWIIVTVWLLIGALIFFGFVFSKKDDSQELVSKHPIALGIASIVLWPFIIVRVIIKFYRHNRT